MGGLVSLSLLFCMTLIAAWLNHIFTCFSIEAWGFLVAGAILPPIGVLHGIYLWFN